MAVIYYPSSEGELVREITRPLAAIPIALYGLYIFIQYQDTADQATPTWRYSDSGGCCWQDWLSS
jgi:hypothetical protein